MKICVVSVSGRLRMLLNQIPILVRILFRRGCRLTRDKKISKNCRDMLFISPQLTEQKGKIGLLRKTL